MYLTCKIPVNYWTARRAFGSVALLGRELKSDLNRDKGPAKRRTEIQNTSDDSLQCTVHEDLCVVHLCSGFLPPYAPGSKLLGRPSLIPQRARIAHCVACVARRPVSAACPPCRRRYDRDTDFFNRFAEQARTANTESKHGVLDELLKAENDPIYFLTLSGNVAQFAVLDSAMTHGIPFTATPFVPTSSEPGPDDDRGWNEGLSNEHERGNSERKSAPGREEGYGEPGVTAPTTALAVCVPHPWVPGSSLSGVASVLRDVATRLHPVFKPILVLLPLEKSVLNHL
ncbi:uncharacterized protein C8Q71DRAFT_726682 [Rhodofomes roseus]|uniref:Uncharacterized protein n=1 Tax=Rhodofomes roseus TaxID=34475 RepID=A0ABQ8K536_9APHY|nr:uncharacterized protein C8Q71DRAFT_726682 [Rhodofomes roseus]KAH9831828.1 hypothetical protein C8Q71DRAFT_726682 [Rhodofomes roseus]